MPKGIELARASDLPEAPTLENSIASSSPDVKVIPSSSATLAHKGIPLAPGVAQIAQLAARLNINPTELAAALYRAAIARRYVSSFRDFFVGAWPNIEPTRALAPSIAVDGICAALQAWAEGRIRRLAIACPPGVSKSLLCAVAFPAWLELRMAGMARVMCGSYAQALAERDSMRCRSLVESQWYRDQVRALGQTWSLREDANKVSDWWTDASGRRLCVSPGGKTIGERAIFQIIDDALSARDQYSAAKREEAETWIREALPSRLEDPLRDPRLIIGQRLCVGDPVGIVVEAGWRYFRLPAFADDNPCILLDDHGVEVWRDPRAKGDPIGGLLTTAALESIRDDPATPSSMWSAQYQQDPKGGAGAIDRSWWRFWSRDPATFYRRPAGCDERSAAVPLPPSFDRIVVTADLTFGSQERDASFAAVHAWGGVGADRYLLRRWKRQCGTLEQEAQLKEFARQYPGVRIIIEKKAHGSGAIETLTAAGVPNVEGVEALGSKGQRLGLVEATIEHGHCFLPLDDPDLEAFVEELAGATKHDDEQDCTAYAVHELDVRAAEQTPTQRAEALGPTMRRMMGRIASRRMGGF